MRIQPVRDVPAQETSASYPEAHKWDVTVGCDLYCVMLESTTCYPKTSRKVYFVRGLMLVVTQGEMKQIGVMHEMEQRSVRGNKLQSGGQDPAKVKT